MKDTPQDDASLKLVPAVGHAIRLLRLIASRGQPMGATALSREAGLSVSSAFNILRTLTHEGLVDFDPVAKTYILGMGVLDLSAPLLGADPADLIRPMLRDIAQRHRMMIALWQITGTQRIVLIDRFTPERTVQAVIAPNSRLPVFGGAIGRCYAAALGLDRNAARAGYDGVRWQADPGFDTWWSDVQAARESGTGFDHGNLFRGLDIVAALARDDTGTPRLGLSGITVTGQHDAVSLTDTAASLAAACRRIERGLFSRTNP
jgi:DNA-binding IclR family transcriptional regulator